jgi:hypothetical protein
MMPGSLNGARVGVAVEEEKDLAERGTPEFYREQGARLVKLATGLTSPAARLELLEIARVFQKLADRSSA